MVAMNESGYLMEQAVATQLEQRGIHVNTNVAFEDPDEGKSREMDVQGIQRVGYNEKEKLAAYVEYIIECKNSSNPLVFVARPKHGADRNNAPREFLFPFEYKMSKLAEVTKLTTYREVPAYRHLGFDKVFNETKIDWKAVQFCRIDRKGGGWHANHGGLYDATFFPMVKAFAARKKALDSMKAHRTDSVIWLFFPLVVTTSDLFLIDSSEPAPAPKLVDYITFKRELRSAMLTGTFMLTFVHLKALEAFLATVVDPMAKHATDLIMNRTEFFRTQVIPWSD
ncbi:hypothetical protein [Mesorhizobium sp. B2-8-3]|uniref:hypothetical protein n=1 Tax=Mesorhizobium sp. B2-8-3 TaxID=2589905 RepID=UPI0011297050|nr:hypothetical protein [Mesorhizobium sp. B2-8-3]TPJ37168.1 hypothetical protein FJ418_02690 [Mesorhizobium sp. B2-8-3]